MSFFMTVVFLTLQPGTCSLPHKQADLTNAATNANQLAPVS